MDHDINNMNSAQTGGSFHIDLSIEDSDRDSTHRNSSNHKSVQEPISILIQKQQLKNGSPAGSVMKETSESISSFASTMDISALNTNIISDSVIGINFPGVVDPATSASNSITNSSSPILDANDDRNIHQNQINESFSERFPGMIDSGLERTQSSTETLKVNNAESQVPISKTLPKNKPMPSSFSFDKKFIRHHLQDFSSLNPHNPFDYEIHSDSFSHNNPCSKNASHENYVNFNVFNSTSSSKATIDNSQSLYLNRSRYHPRNLYVSRTTSTTSTKISDWDPEWTEQDSSYGAAFPICGWLPKSVRRAIEFTFFGTFILVAVGFVVSTSVRVGNNSNEEYQSSSSSSLYGFDDAYYDDMNQTGTDDYY